MADVLFGQGYCLRFDPKLFAAGQPYPPLGTLYAAACARDRGYEVALFDSTLAESEADWGKGLERHRPRFAVLYEDGFNALTRTCLGRMREASFAMIRMARARGCTVVVAGADATDHAETYLEQGTDAVVMGEGEATLVELLDALSGRRPLRLADVQGLCYRDARGRVCRTPPRAALRDLDALPFPAWDLVDVEQYRRLWKARHGHHSMNLVTSRGCPYHCNWCANPVRAQRVASRSPESVAAEMAWLKRHYAPDQLCFADDVFGVKPGWVERFAELVSSGAAAIPFTCLCRPDLLEPGVVEALRRARCRTVWLGAESGSQRVLDAMEKGVRVEEIYGAARRLREAGLEVGFVLQFGCPGETRADIEETLRMVRECRPDDIGISESASLAGATLHERAHAPAAAAGQGSQPEDAARADSPPYGNAFYRTLHRAVQKEFRVRKIWSNGPRLRQVPALLYDATTLPLDRLRLDRLARHTAGRRGESAWTSS